MIAARRVYLLAGAFLVGSVGCGVMALVRRDNVEDALPFEGAYFNRAEGEPSSGGVFTFGDSLFDPFHWLNAYLWLGLAVAFFVCALLLAVMARVGETKSPKLSE